MLADAPSGSGAGLRGSGSGLGAATGADNGEGAGSGAARRPPGTGRMTVRSLSSGSENGLSLMPSPATGYPRIAQSSSRRLGKSPDTWMAKPPEVCICCQCGLLRSSSKYVAPA